jgi:hypothetical protein
MSVNLNRRVAALEAARSPAGPVLGFWAMTENCEPMTEQEIEKKTAAMRKAGAPANARIVPTWLPVCDPV